MSVLVISLPPRDRLGARAAGAEAVAGLRLPQEWDFVFSADRTAVAQAGRAAAALLPKAEETVLLLADADVSWHRVKVPKAPSARLRAALAGTLEEALLDDEESLHYALGPGAVPGQEGWVAVTHRPRLVAALNAIEASGPSVRRVVTSMLPGVARGHFFMAGETRDAEPWLALSRPDGAGCLRLSGSLPRTLLAAAGQAPPRWTATPAAAAAAESWLSTPVPLCGDAERALEAAAGALNLRQFDLAARTRRSRQLVEMGQRLLSREWRPVRIGLAAVAALHLIGLNAYAWQQQQAAAARREAMTALLRAAHPGVRAVLDAPVQMERETDRLRAAAGRPGGADLETLLGAVAAAWPDGQGPAQTLRFETGRLQLSAAGWGEPQTTQFRQRLVASGFVPEFADGRISVGRAPARGAR